MITTEGKFHVKRYLAGHVPSIAQAIAFGIGSQTETLADANLQLESGRTPILLSTYDFINNAVVFKGTVPSEYAGKIYEVGLYSLFDNSTSGNYGSRIITTFDSVTEEWLTNSAASVYTSVATRIGIDSLNHTPAASATSTSVLNNVLLDFSGNSSADEFAFAYNTANTNTASVTFRLKTDNSNYYSFSDSSPTAGYHVSTFTKGSATVTGTPDWANITQVEVVTVSNGSGASNVEFDAIRIEDKDSVNLSYILVARKVLAVPVTNIDGRPQDIEYSLAVTV